MITALVLFTVGKVSDTLDHAFTLVYSITWHDLRSKETKEKLLDGDRIRLQTQVDRNAMSKEDMAANLERERQGLSETVRTGEVTLSYDGRNLVADFSPEPCSGRHVVILRNNHTYYLSPEPSGTSNASMGYDPCFLQKLPIVGPSLPHIPIEQDGKIISLVAAANSASDDASRFSYVPGEIRHGADGSIKSILYGSDPHHRREGYSFAETVDFQGTKLGDKISFTRYNSEDSLNWGRPSERCDYALLMTESRPLDARAFDAENYLPEGAHIDVTCSNGKHTSFTYRNSRGSFDEQEALAEESAD